MVVAAVVAPTTLLGWFQPSLILTALLIVTRTSGLFLTAPLLNHSGIPPQVKMMLCMAISLLLFTTIGLPWAIAHPGQVPTTTPFLVVQMAQELMIGLMMGLAANWLFNSILAAGELLSTQMGLSAANSLDPTLGTPAPLVGQVLLWMALALFVTNDVHHGLIEILHWSFGTIPLAHHWHWQEIGPLAERLVLLSATLYVSGLLLALPILALLLLYEAALAFVSKLLPAMNLFMVAMPIKVALGFWALGLFMPFAADWVAAACANLPQQTAGWMLG
jgi:flagellar biosynthesis protein FliR